MSLALVLQAASLFLIICSTGSDLFKAELVSWIG